MLVGFKGHGHGYLQTLLSVSTS
ncbi:hypothetical protein CTRU02_204603 [Colletotrichum truncatum]|uniref:Uncharacterized protein n=1 Tax=Colletotrichum truncatum TaxID=5467 RepID=A0ACC3ZCI9_COLTU|nr:hypothetical protein CTRU02_02833 [Colletotrichum truncatum]